MSAFQFCGKQHRQPKVSSEPQYYNTISDTLNHQIQHRRLLPCVSHPLFTITHRHHANVLRPEDFSPVIRC